MLSNPNHIYWFKWILRFINRQCSWWRHQMETLPAILALCAGNSPVTGEFPSQGPVTRSSDVSFHLRLNKHLKTQSRGRWYETPSCSLWRHRNEKQIRLMSNSLVWVTTCILLYNILPNYFSKTKMLVYLWYSERVYIRPIGWILFMSWKIK